MQCTCLCVCMFGCPVYNYTNMCFVSEVLLIKRSKRYKAPIWIIVRSHAHAHRSIHNTFWQSNTEQHAHQSSPCLSSPAPLQGADVWGQLTASANFCVQSKQQHSALLAAKGNLLLNGGGSGGEGRPLSQRKVSWGWGGEGEKSEKGCTQRWNCVKVAGLLHRKIPCFLRHLVLCVVQHHVYTVHTVSPRGIMQHQ